MKIVLHLTALAFVFVSLVGCSKIKKLEPSSSIQTSQSASIINGVIVPPENELGQSTVGLLVNVNGTWYQMCTASIIAENMILTAAHCVGYVNKLRDNIVVNFSLTTVDNSIQADPEQTHVTDVSLVFNTIGVVEIIEHPDYQGDVDNDIAIIRLKQNIPSTHKPADFLPSIYVDTVAQKLTFDGETKNVSLFGFGLTSEADDNGSTVLRMTTVPAQFKGSVLVTDQTHGTGACNGDSGGPAFVTVDAKNYLVGVTHGPYMDFVTCHELGAYLNPNLYFDFIKKTIFDLNAIVF